MFSTKITEKVFFIENRVENRKKKSETKNKRKKNYLRNMPWYYIMSSKF